MAGRIALLGLVAGVLTALYVQGFFGFVQDPERVRAALHALGIWAPVLYVVGFSLLEPFFVPGLAFVIPGAFVWDFPTLFALSWLGSVGAGVVGFGFARYLGRGFVSRNMPPRFQAYAERIADRGLRTVILVRLTFFLAPPAHWFLGLSGVSFGAFVLGTAIGFVPGIAALTYIVVFLGSTLGDWIAAQPGEMWLALVASIGLWIFVRRRLVRRRAAEAAERLSSERGSI